MPKLFNTIFDQCSYLSEAFSEIDEERKEKLLSLASYITTKLDQGEIARLIVICTHNSRRSHMGQLWLAAAAEFYGVTGVKTYSGGTEGTAFFPNAIDAMQKIGFLIEGDRDESNPRYQICWDKEMNPIEVFSKRFDESPNPTNKFGAIMVCTSADEACPIVPGAEIRVALPFEDPKLYDGTPLASAKYFERAQDIGREMLWMMSKVKVKQATPPIHHPANG